MLASVISGDSACNRTQRMQAKRNAICELQPEHVVDPSCKVTFGAPNTGAHHSHSLLDAGGSRRF